MILDNQQQKELLVNVINAVPMNGTYQQIRETVSMVDELLKAVMEAEIQKG